MFWDKIQMKYCLGYGPILIEAVNVAAHIYQLFISKEMAEHLFLCSFLEMCMFNAKNS